MGCLNCKKKKEADTEEETTEAEEGEEEEDDEGEAEEDEGEEEEEEDEEEEGALVKTKRRSSGADERERVKSIKSEETSTTDLNSDEPIVLKLALQLDIDVNKTHSSDEKNTSTSGSSGTSSEQHRDSTSTEEKKSNRLEAISEKTTEPETDIQDKQKKELMQSTSRDRGLLSDTHQQKESVEKLEKHDEKTSSELKNKSKETSSLEKKDENTEITQTSSVEKTQASLPEKTKIELDTGSHSTKRIEDQKTSSSLKKEHYSSDTTPHSPKGEDQKTLQSEKKEDALSDTKSHPKAVDQKTPKQGKTDIASKVIENMKNCIKPTQEEKEAEPDVEKETQKRDSTKKGDASSSRKLHGIFFDTESVRHSQASESNSVAADDSAKKHNEIKEKKTDEDQSGRANEDAEEASENIKEEKSLLSDSTAQASAKKDKRPLVMRDDRIKPQEKSASSKPGSPRVQSKKPSAKITKKEVRAGDKPRKELSFLQKLSHIKELPFPDLYHPREHFDKEKFVAEFNFKAFLPTDRAHELLASSEAAAVDKKHEDRKFLVLESQSKCICNFSLLNERCGGREGLRCSIRGRNANEVATMMAMIEYMDPSVIYFAVFDKAPLDSCSATFKSKARGMNIRRFVKPVSEIF